MISDRRDVQIPISIEVFDLGPICFIHRIEVGFLEIQVSPIQVDANPMIPFQGIVRVRIPIVSIQSEDVQRPIPIEIAQLESNVTKGWMLFPKDLLLKAAFGVVDE